MAASGTMDGVAASEGTCEPARRGRPRTAGVDEAVLTATLALAAEVGITKLSMDDVAERAGVSKATIYRRWSSKEALVIEALRSAMRPIDDVDTGSLRSDLEAYLGELVRRLDGGPMHDVLPHLIEVANHDEQIRSSLDDYVQFRRLPLRALLGRAVARNELAGDTDLDVLIDAVVGPFVYRRLLQTGPVDERFVRCLLDILLPGR